MSKLYGPEGSDRINSFAVVTYIRGAMAEFLDRLRAELVCGCNSHAHVTILPPRPLDATPEEVVDFISSEIPRFQSFPIDITGVRVFPITQVIYLDIAMGRTEMHELHDVLNRGPLYFEEPFEYHPHITLAQGLMPEEVTALVELAQKRWSEFKRSRQFTVDRLTFVQNTVENRWLDLTDWTLARPAEVYSR